MGYNMRVAFYFIYIRLMLRTFQMIQVPSVEHIPAGETHLD